MNEDTFNTSLRGFLKKVGITSQREIEKAVRDALAHLDVVTFFGLIKFDQRGLNVFKPMVVNQIQGVKLVTIYPYRLADAAPVSPSIITTGIDHHTWLDQIGPSVNVPQVDTSVHQSR